jgi:hypothetical protein
VPLQFLNAFSDILNFLLNPNSGPAPEFVMEVTDKTRADVKVCVTLQFVIIYINVVKPILIVWLASAATNEMGHREFNKGWPHPPRVN